MRIGIFGGTFDPPHEGHKRFADEFIVRLSLDKLLVIPTCIPPHKENTDTADGADRLKMCEILFGDDKKVQVSDMEIAREGKSYTCETVRLLTDEYPDDELIFLLGSDMLLSFHRWWKPEEIIKYVKICAVTRSGNVGEKALELYVDKFFPDNKDRFIICKFKPVEVSSTEIRERIKSGRSTDGLLNPQVMEYIKEKELYL